MSYLNYMSKTYSSFYEDRTQQDFLNLVDNLVQEGYDLSDYTYDELYAYYLNEQPSFTRPTPQSIAQYRAKKNMQRQSQESGARKALQSGKTLQAGGLFGRSNVSLDSPATKSSGRSTLRISGSTAMKDPTINLGGQKYYLAKLGGKDVYVSGQKQSPKSVINAPIQTGSSSDSIYTVLNRPGVQNRFIQDRRPSLAQARPSIPTRSSPIQTRSAVSTRPATAAVRPIQQANLRQVSSQSPVLGYQLAQKGSNIGSNILQQRPSLAQQSAEDLRRMRQRSQERIAAQGRTPATPLVQSFDPFDIVMGHLIDEGFAENEEAAVVIMSNMSEEWIQSILEV